jgi:hypothetical protein
MSFPTKVATPKSALLVCGEAGSGKTEWIRSQAKLRKAQLFRWNTRIDRSLREGREVLHQLVRARDTVYVWLEGADDLTQEAQAFLRRILETASSNITCVLEVREPWKLSPPILSRCKIINMPLRKSYRQAKNMEMAIGLGLVKQVPLPKEIAYTDLNHLKNQGVDPYSILDWCIAKYGWGDTLLQRCIRGTGGGSSCWAQIAFFLHSKSETR